MTNFLEELDLISKDPEFADIAQYLREAHVEIQRCHERLEIDHEFVVRSDYDPEIHKLNDDALVKKEIPYEDRAEQIDGIECRDATITELQEQLDRLILESVDDIT